MDERVWDNLAAGNSNLAFLALSVSAASACPTDMLLVS